MAKKKNKVIPYKKAQIPRALREQVWIEYSAKQFETKCFITWCNNRINAFDFQVGHNVPESKGGKTEIANLRPICSRCNLSMGSKYSIDEWAKLSEVSLPNKTVPEVTPTKKAWWCC